MERELSKSSDLQPVRQEAKTPVTSEVIGLPTVRQMLDKIRRDRIRELNSPKYDGSVALGSRIRSPRR